MRAALVSIYIILLAVLQGVAQPVEFTLEDRDRIIRTEVRLEELQKQMELQFNDVQRQFNDVQRQFNDVQRQFDDIQRQFDDLRTFQYWAFGIVIGIIGSLFAFIIWDRRTTMGSILRSNEELKHDNRQMLYVARQYALKDPEYRKIMKNAGLL